MTRSVRKHGSREQLHERAAIGGLLLDSSALEDVLRRGVTASSFRNVSLGLIYSSMVRLAHHGQEPTYEAVQKDLAQRGELTQVGGATIFAALAAATDEMSLGAAVEQLTESSEPGESTPVAHSRISAANPVSIAEVDGVAGVRRQLDEYRSRSLGAIMKDPDVLQPPQALVGRIAFPSRVTLFAAREKSGKSTFATAMVAAYTRGQSFLGDASPAGCVLWVSLEEADADLVQRLAAFGADPDRTFIAGPAEIANMRDIEHETRRPGIGLVIIDSLSKIAEREGIDEGGNAQKWSLLLSRITLIARTTKAAVLLLHHMNKDGGYRDSTSIGAGVDIICEMDDGSADDPFLRKMRPKGRISVPGFSVRYDPAGPRFTIAGGDLTPDARALAHAAANPGQSKRSLAGALGGRVEGALDLVDRLLTRGALVDRGNKHGAKLYVAGPGYPTLVPSERAFPDNPQTEASETRPETLPDRFPSVSTPVPAGLTRFPADTVSGSDPLSPGNGKRPVLCLVSDSDVEETI